MNRLIELTENFKTSRAIFRLTKDEDGRMIRVIMDESEYRYRPQPEKDNVLSQLVCESYKESFNTQDGAFSINRHDIAKDAMNEIIDWFKIHGQ